MHSAVREFLFVLAGGAAGCLLGGGFGVAIGTLSPEFIDLLTHPQRLAAPERVGAAMGLILGLLTGATAMVAGRLVGAAWHWAGRGPGGKS